MASQKTGNLRIVIRSNADIPKVPQMNLGSGGYFETRITSIQSSGEAINPKAKKRRVRITPAVASLLVDQGYGGSAYPKSIRPNQGPTA